MFFTQFLQPNGQKRQVQIEVPIDIEEKAQKVIELGWRYEIEILSTGIINMDCCNDLNQLTNRLCFNQEEVKENVIELVEDSYAKRDTKFEPETADDYFNAEGEIDYPLFD